MAQSTGLAGGAATANVRVDVVSLESFGVLEGLPHDLVQCDPRKIFVEGAAIDDDLARTCQSRTRAMALLRLPVAIVTSAKFQLLWIL